MEGSLLALDIDGLTPGNGAGHYDTLVLTGANSVYTADGTIAPPLRGITGSANNDFTPKIGQTFQAVTAEGGVQGTFDALEQPSAGLPRTAGSTSSIRQTTSFWPSLQTAMERCSTRSHLATQPTSAMRLMPCGLMPVSLTTAQMAVCCRVRSEEHTSELQ